MTAREKLLAEIETFLKATGLNSTRFSIEATGDRAFMTRLRKGNGVNLDTAQAVRDFMGDYKRKNPKQRRGSFQPAA